MAEIEEQPEDDNGAPAKTIASPRPVQSPNDCCRSPYQAGSSKLLSRLEGAPLVAKRLPPIYVDEHLPPEVAQAFRDEGFRVIKTRRSRGLAGRDEMDYLAELRRDRGVFVTSDQQYVDRIRTGRHKHPGVVLLDREWDPEATVALAGVMAETIKAAIAVLGSKGFYDIVLEPALGGLYYTESRGEKRLFMSWARYFDAPLG